MRLLGTYDNVWLSHQARDRAMTPEGRQLWMGVNGARANALFVDGWMTGMWRVEEGRVVVKEMLRELTADEKAELEGEVARVERLLGS